jgi:hypothetical protein
MCAAARIASKHYQIQFQEQTGGIRPDLPHLFPDDDAGMDPATTP